MGKRKVGLPYAYLYPSPDPKVITKLLQHGIEVEKLIKPAHLEVEFFRITELHSEERIYQGHHLNWVKGEYKKEKKTFLSGTVVVKTGQPLGNLAAYLLEPESDDGLLVWNFFDRYLVHQWKREPQTYPVYKLLQPVNLVTQALR